MSNKFYTVDVIRAYDAYGRGCQRSECEKNWRIMKAMEQQLNFYKVQRVSDIEFEMCHHARSLGLSLLFLFQMNSNE